jgi:hypothetical protein
MFRESRRTPKSPFRECESHLPILPKVGLRQCRLEDARDEVEEDNTLISNDHEMLVANLNVGEHFTVIITKDNLEDDDF